MVDETVLGCLVLCLECPANAMGLSQDALSRTCSKDMYLGISCPVFSDLLFKDLSWGVTPRQAYNLCDNHSKIATVLTTTIANSR